MRSRVVIDGLHCCFRVRCPHYQQQRAAGIYLTFEYLIWSCVVNEKMKHLCCYIRQSSWSKTVSRGGSFLAPDSQQPLSFFFFNFFSWWSWYSWDLQVKITHIQGQQGALQKWRLDFKVQLFQNILTTTKKDPIHLKK